MPLKPTPLLKLLLLPCLALVACADVAPGAQDPGACRTDRDCPSPQTCQAGACAAQLCQSSQECPFAFDCIQGVCTEIEDYCNRNSDCRNGLLCDRASRRCVPLDQAQRACTDDSACFAGERCQGGFCTDDPEPEPEPDLPPDLPETPDLTQDTAPDLPEPPQDLPQDTSPGPDLPQDLPQDEPDMIDPPDLRPEDVFDEPDMTEDEADAPEDLPVDEPDMADEPDLRPEDLMDEPEMTLDEPDMTVDEPDMDAPDIFVPPPTPPPGFYDYRLLELGGLGGLQTVRFAPSGQAAVALEIYDKVHVINPATEQVTTLEPTPTSGYRYSFQDIAFDPSGQFALIVGLEYRRTNTSTTQGVILRLDLGDPMQGGDTPPEPTLTRYQVTLERAIYDILYPWDGGLPVLLADREVANGFHNAVLRNFDPEAGAFGDLFTAAISQDSCRHMAYAVNGFGRRGFFLSCNFHLLYYTEVGGVGEWRMDRELDAGNLGNTLGTTEHRPGDYALLFTGFGTRRMRMFRAGLLREQHMSLSSHNPSYAAFQQEGQRALLIGDNSGRLLEYRHGTFEGCTSDPYGPGCLTDASLNLGAPPYSAPENGRSVYFTGAAWKPGCDGGYLVTNNNSSRGMIIAFQLVGGRSCAP